MRYEIRGSFRFAYLTWVRRHFGPDRQRPSQQKRNYSPGHDVERDQCGGRKRSKVARFSARGRRRGGGGADGGWGQDGGAASYVRQNENLESKGNDVANTAVAALALLRAGDRYRPNVERAVDFILKKIEASPNDGLSITDVNQTQIQRKL